MYMYKWHRRDFKNRESKTKDLTLLCIGVNLTLRQCIQVCASLSGTQTAACSVAGLLLPTINEYSKLYMIYKTDRYL